MRLPFCYLPNNRWNPILGDITKTIFQRAGLENAFYNPMDFPSILNLRLKSPQDRAIIMNTVNNIKFWVDEDKAVQFLGRNPNYLVYARLKKQNDPPDSFLIVSNEYEVIEKNKESLFYIKNYLINPNCKNKRSFILMRDILAEYLDVDLDSGFENAQESKMIGSKEKVKLLMEKLLSDNNYEPNEEENWLIYSYTNFKSYKSLHIKFFQKFYDFIFNELRDKHQMSFIRFSEMINNSNEYIVDWVINSFVDYVKKEKVDYLNKDKITIIKNNNLKKILLM